MIASKANGANAKVIEGVAEPVPTARKARKQRKSDVNDVGESMGTDDNTTD